MKAFVDRTLCTGCGLCIEICPKVFEMDDDNVARVVCDLIPTEVKHLAQEAASTCPFKAISF